MASTTEVTIRQEIRSVLHEGRLPCPRAFGVSQRLSTTPLRVGDIANAMSIRISHCQLGLFGYGAKSEGTHRIVVPALEVSRAMRSTIETSLIGGRLPCKAAWDISEKFSCSRLSVCAAAEALSTPISECQLGCFQ